MAPTDSKVTGAGDRRRHGRWGGAIAPVDRSQRGFPIPSRCQWLPVRMNVLAVPVKAVIFCAVTLGPTTIVAVLLPVALALLVKPVPVIVLVTVTVRVKAASTSIGVSAIDSKGGTAGCHGPGSGGAIAPVDGSREGSLPWSRCQLATCPLNEAPAKAVMFCAVTVGAARTVAVLLLEAEALVTPLTVLVTVTVSMLLPVVV